MGAVLDSPTLRDARGGSALRRAPPSLHARIIFGCDALLCVAMCYVAFGAFRGLDSVLRACCGIGRFVTRGRPAQLSPRQATIAVALSSVGLLWIAVAWPLMDAAGSPTVQAGLVTVSTALVTLLYAVIPAALVVPPTLEEIRSRTAGRAFENWVAIRMGNPLDAVWIGPLTAVLALSAPAWLGLVLPGTIRPMTVIWYAAAILLCSETVATFEHANGHYRFFRSRASAGRPDRVAFGALRLLVEQVLDVMLARIPRWYGVEHVLVHHVEDNGPADLQSTERYDRASFIDFARCANRFALSGMLPLDVMWYLRRQRRWAGMRQLLTGLVVFYATLALVGVWNWRAVVLLLALRYANLVRGSLTFFQEHGLVDTAEPGNIYRNSLHYINRGNSHASLGEDPHIEHHLHPGRHWSDYVSGVERDMQRYASERAAGFLDGPGCVRRYYQLMWAGNFRELASMFVVYGMESAGADNVAALLEARTRPVTGGTRSIQCRSLDRLFGRGAGLLLT